MQVSCTISSWRWTRHTLTTRINFLSTVRPRTGQFEISWTQVVTNLWSPNSSCAQLNLILIYAKHLLEIMNHRKESCSAEVKNQWLYSNPATYIKQEYDMRIRTERDFKNPKYEWNLSNALKNFERNLSKYFRPNENSAAAANDAKDLSGWNTQDSR